MNVSDRYIWGLNRQESLGGNLVEGGWREGQNNRHESIRMAFCSRHLEGRGQVCIAERGTMVVRDLRVKEQEGSCEAGEQKGQRVSSPHSTLPQSFDMADPSPSSMYMADC